MPALQLAGGTDVPESQETVGPLGLEIISHEVREIRRNAQEGVIKSIEAIPEGDNKTNRILELLRDILILGGTDKKYQNGKRQDVNRNDDGKHPESDFRDKRYELIYPDSPLRPILVALDKVTLEDFLDSSIYYMPEILIGKHGKRLQDELTVIIEEKFGNKHKKFAQIYIKGLKVGGINIGGSVRYGIELDGFTSKEIEKYNDFVFNIGRTK